MKASAKRERPADGGMPYNDRLHFFHCYGCEEDIEVRHQVYIDPEKLHSFREMLILDHTECWEFDDPQMAADARRYRKAKKRRELLAKNNVQWRGVPR